MQEMGLDRPARACGWTAATCDALSRGARALLDEAGLHPGARIFASGGLDELEVQELVADGAPLDAFGIGTQMGVSADAPFVDSVYKLVDVDGRPVLKLSAGKATAPGRKQVWRGQDADVLALRDEPGPPGAEPLLVPVMRDGVRTGAAPSIDEMRARFDADLAALPAERGGSATRRPSTCGIRRRWWSSPSPRARKRGAAPAPTTTNASGRREPGWPARLVGRDRRPGCAS